jgi:hypothetical protein
MQKFIEFATKDGSFPEHLPMDSHWNIEKPLIKYDYSQKIQPEQIAKLIIVFK